jgi:hypothetical protein
METGKDLPTDAEIDLLFQKHVRLARELLGLIGGAAGFEHWTRIREIGEELNRVGGLKLLRANYEAVKKSGVYFSPDIWDGIGGWRG